MIDIIQENTLCNQTILPSLKYQNILNNTKKIVRPQCNYHLSRQMSSLSDSPDLCVTIMEDAVTSWGQRLEGVVRQEVERCAEVTEWAREALRHAAASGGKPRPRDTRPSCISRVLC